MGPTAHGRGSLATSHTSSPYPTNPWGMLGRTGGVGVFATSYGSAPIVAGGWLEWRMEIKKEGDQTDG